MSSRIKALLSILGLVVLGWFIWKFAFIIIYFLIAAVLALIARPLTDFLCKVKIGRFVMPRTVAALLTMAAYFLVIAAFVMLFIPLVAEQGRIIANIDSKQVVRSLEEPLSDLERYLIPLGMEPSSLEKEVQDWVTGLIDMTSISNIFSSTIGFIGNLIVGLFAVLFILFYLLKDKHLSTRIVLAITPDQYEIKVNRVLRNSKKLLRKYLGGLTLQTFLFAIVIAIGLSILGVKYALLIAFFAGFANVIPYIGPILGGVLGVFIAITTNLELNFYQEISPLIVKVIVVFWIAQSLDNYIIQPRIFSNVVKAHPLEIFIVVLFAGYVSGIVAMIIAIPTYTIIRILAIEFFSEFKVVKALTSDLEEDMESVS
ncbi:MAG: putative PurR-regulated permease PerM [Limisphaerales bacterium]|jgi:predicted PurR-regulated permease PerM